MSSFLPSCFILLKWYLTKFFITNNTAGTHTLWHMLTLGVISHCFLANHPQTPMSVVSQSGWVPPSACLDQPQACREALLLGGNTWHKAEGSTGPSSSRLPCTGNHSVQSLLRAHVNSVSFCGLKPARLQGQGNGCHLWMEESAFLAKRHRYRKGTCCEHVF